MFVYYFNVDLIDITIVCFKEITDIVLSLVSFDILF